MNVRTVVSVLIAAGLLQACDSKVAKVPGSGTSTSESGMNRAPSPPKRQSTSGIFLHAVPSKAAAPTRISDLGSTDVTRDMEKVRTRLGAVRYAKAFAAVSCRRDLARRRAMDPSSMPSLILEADGNPKCDGA